MRQEITRSGSHDNINTKETEITEVTETIEGGTVTTVKRKVVTVSHGKEEIVEDSQILLDENHTTFSSVVDSGFVVVEKEDTPDSSLDTTAITEDQGNYWKLMFTYQLFCMLLVILVSLIKETEMLKVFIFHITTYQSMYQ